MANVRAIVVDAAGYARVATPQDTIVDGSGSTALQTGSPDWSAITNKPASYPASTHAHSATDIASGTLATARLGSGAANGATFLRGDQTWAAPVASGGWTTVKLGSDFSTTSSSAQNVTGLLFTPAANTDYEFEAVLMTRTATATVGPRPGLSWPAGLSDGAAAVQQTSSATANVFANGNISGAILAPVGGLPTTTGSWLATICGVCRAGANPSGNVQVQLASETNGTSVTIRAGSLLRYRVV